MSLVEIRGFQRFPRLYLHFSNFLIIFIAQKEVYMKQNFIWFCFTLLAFSCNSDLDNSLNPQKVEKKLVENGPLKNIKDYITNVRLGGKSSRNVSEEEYTLSPYTYKGDTIMYIANYKDGGWELLSMDYRAPLVIVSSDTGIFDAEEQAKETPAVAAYLSLIGEDLSNLSDTPFDSSQIDNSWRTVKLFNDEIEPTNIQVAPRATGTQPGTNGSWVLLESTTPQVETICPARLTTTNWEQGYPWNEYVPYYENSTAHAPAGCAPVAVAQYLYYLHYKYGNPATTINSATYLSSNTYEYSGSSSTVWDLMAKTKTDSGTEYAAMFIGYVGKSCYTDYAETEAEGSGTNPEDALSFINGFGYSFYSADIDYDYIYGKLQLREAILASAKCTETECGSHRFIIDGYEKTTTNYTNTYGWIGEDNFGNDTNDRDENGNVIGYSFFYEDEVKNTTWSLMMNWGYSSYTNSLKYTTSNWNAGGHYFNSNRKIFKSN